MAYVIHIEICNGCGVCLKACPLGAIKQEADIYTIDPEICTDCGSCSDMCPLGAISGQ